MPSFSFPLLNKNEICTRLATMGAPKVSVENLTTPSSDALLPLYEFLTSFSLSLENREESMQPGFQAVQMLGDHPELYLESYGTLKSFDRLRRFMEAAGVEDFWINDVYRPESQRTIRLLSAAINFIMYCMQKQALFAQLNSTKDEEIAKLEELCEEKSKIESEIAHIEQERAAELPQVEALEREIKELNTQIQVLNKQQHSLQMEISNLKQEDVGILDKISNLDFEIMQKQQEGAHIRSQLVENPQELQKMLQEKKSALAEEEVLARSAAQNCEIWKAKVGVILKAEKKLLKLQTLLQSAEDHVNNRDIDKVLKERKARQKAIEKEEWALDAKKEELTWGVKRLEELSEKLSQQCLSVSKDLEAMKAREEQCKADQNARRRTIKGRDIQTEAVRNNHAKKVMQKKKQIAQLRDVGNQLAKAVMKYTEVVTPNAEMLDMLGTKGYHRRS